MNRHRLLLLMSRRRRWSPGPPPLLFLLLLRPPRKPNSPRPQNCSGFLYLLSQFSSQLPNPAAKPCCWVIRSSTKQIRLDRSGSPLLTLSDETRSDPDNRIGRAPASGCKRYRIPEAFRAPLMQRRDVICI